MSPIIDVDSIKRKQLKRYKFYPLWSGFVNEKITYSMKKCVSSWLSVENGKLESDVQRDIGLNSG